MSNSNRRTTATLSLSMLVVAQLAVLLSIAPHTAAAPFVATEAQTKDLDADGRIDAITLSFSGGIADDSVRPQDFLLTCKSGLTGCPSATITIVPYDVLTGPSSLSGNAISDGGLANDGLFTLLFDENLGMRTDALPDLTYKPGSMTGINGEAVGEIVAGSSPAVANPPEYKKGLVEKDGAAPVFIGANTIPGKKEVILAFSEPVQPIGGGAFSITQFTYTDASASGIEDRSASTNFPNPPASRIRLLVEKPGDVAVSYTTEELDGDSPQDNIVVSGLSDVAGNVLDASTADPLLAQLTIDQPRIRADSAFGGEGSNQVALYFNGPVTGKNGAALTPGSFQVVPASSGGAVSNVVSVDYFAGSDLVVLTLNGRLNANDMVGDPGGARIQISSADAVQGPSGGPSGTDVFKIVPGSAFISDVDAPRLLGVKGLDVDQDGQLDVLQLTFNENLADPDPFDTFPWVINPPGTKKIYDPAEIDRVAFSPVLVFSDTSDAVAGAHADDCVPGSTGSDFPTSSSNDRFLFLCMNPTDIVAGSTGQLGSTGPLSLGQPSFCAVPPCKIQYLPGSLVTVSYDASSGTLVDAAGIAFEGLTADDFTSDNLIAQDAARPVVLTAKTQDNSKNGFLDGYALQFSEAMLDSSATPADFDVAGRSPITSLTSIVGDADFNGDSGLPDLDGNFVKDLNLGKDDVTPNGLNDEFLLLGFKELDNSDLKKADTGEMPDLVTKGGCCLLSDTNGNKLLPVIAGNDPTDAANVEEVDRARPVLLRVDGAVGLSNLDISFSESVEAAAPSGCGDGPDVDTLPELCAATLAYANNNAGVPSAINNVAHSSGSTDKPHRATVSLNGPLAVADFQQDQLSAADDSADGSGNFAACTDCSLILEQGGDPLGDANLMARRGLSVPVKLLGIGEAPDTTAPAKVTLAEETASTTDNVIVVTWTAPGDDGGSSGTAPTVSGYEVAVASSTESPTGITEDNFDQFDVAGKTSPTCILVGASPGTPGDTNTGLKAPGETQKLTCSKLLSGRQYFVAVRAFDDGKPGNHVNTAALSDTFSVTTKPDTDRPGIPAACAGDANSEGGAPLTLNIATNDVKSNQVKLTWSAPDDNCKSPKGVAVVSYVVKASTTTFTPANAASAPNAPSVTLTTPLAKPGETQEAIIKGLTPDTNYFFSAWGVDAAGNQEDPSAVKTIRTAPADLAAPGPIGAITVDATGTSLTFKWTAPGDDGSGGGSVDHYDMRIVQTGGTALTASSFDGATNVAGASVPTTLTIAAPGQTQSVTITGLIEGKSYQFGVRAVDDANNKDDVTIVDGTTSTAGSSTGGDKTPPGGVVVTNAEPGPVEGTVSLSWIAPGSDGDKGATVTAYLLTVDGTPRAPTLGVLAAAGQTQTALLENLEAGKTVVISIAARDAAGNVGAEKTVSVKVAGATVPTTPVDLIPSDTEIATANHDLQNSLKVSKVGDSNVLEWSAPAVPGGALPDGYQIWCMSSPPRLVGSAGPNQRSFIDNSGCSDGYVVTAYYADSHGYATEFNGVPGQSDLQSSAKKSSSSDGDGLPGWLIAVLIALFVLLLVVGILAVLALRRREEASSEPWPGEEGGQASALESSAPLEGAEAGAAVAASEPWPESGAEPTGPIGGPVYDVTCPKCSAAFTAQGEKPLQIQCPSCGVKGILR